MVNLLCGRDPQAAAELEALWSGVLTTRSVCLLCAYRLDNFDRHVHRGLLHQISRSHSHVVPVEHYERLESRRSRVPRGLRGRGRHRLAPRPPRRRDRSTPVMPPAQAALLALRGLRTDIADAVLERARYYYTAPLDSRSAR